MESQSVDTRIGQMSLDNDLDPEHPVHNRSKSSKRKGRQLLDAVKEYITSRINDGNRQEEQEILDKIQNLATKAGADPNTADPQTGKTCLHYIAQYAMIEHSNEIADWLLSAGASANIVDTDGNTPLLLASMSEIENRTMIEKLTRADGVNVDKRNSDGRSSLHVAAALGRPDTVKILLGAGASPNLENGKGNSALLIAMTYEDQGVRERRTEIARHLIRAGADVNTADSNGRTSLHRACHRGNEEDVDLLLSNGADPTAVDQDGCDALFFVAKSRNVKLVQRLIGAGVNVNYVNEKSTEDDPFMPRSALHVAVMNDNLNILRCLLENGADPNHKNGQSPLCAAARRGHLNSMKLLLEYGADVNCVDTEGHSPLELVSSQNRLFFKPECVQLLVEAGARLRNVLEELVPDASVDDIPDDDEEGEVKMEFVYDEVEDMFRFQPVNNDKKKMAKCHLEKAKCIVRCRVLYESQNPTVSDPMELGNMGGSMELRNYYESCKAEIAKLKSSPLCDSVSYYDILTTHRDFYKRVTDEQVYETFQWKHFEKRFPVYAEDLWELSEKVKDLRKIWKKSVEKLSQCLGFDPAEHYMVIHDILNRLHGHDLESVAKD